MTIETLCSQCQRPLRLKPELAGKRIKCPQCKAVVLVPEPAIAPTPSPPTAKPVVPTPQGPVAVPASTAKTKETPPPTIPRWHLKTEEGEIYGPVPRAELDQWAAQGRLNVDCQLLLDGSDQWQWATELYPELEEEPDAPRSGDVAGKGVAAKSSAPTAPKSLVTTPPSSQAATPQLPVAAPVVAPTPKTAPAPPSVSAPTSAPAVPTAAQPAPQPAPVMTTSSAKSSWRDEPPRASKSRTHAAEKTFDDEPDATDETDAAQEVDDANAAISDRRWVTTFLLAFFLGALGIHRFYLGRVLTGVAMLFTCGGFFIWQIVDVVSIALEKLPDHLGRPLKK